MSVNNRYLMLVFALDRVMGMFETAARGDDRWWSVEISQGLEGLYQLNMKYSRGLSVVSHSYLIDPYVGRDRIEEDVTQLVATLVHSCAQLHRETI